MALKVHTIESTSDPSAAPASINQHWVNTSSGDMWLSKGTASVADWVKVEDTDVKVRVSADDTTGAYLDTKISAGTGITLTELSPGGNESLEVKIDASAVAQDSFKTVACDKGTNPVADSPTDTLTLTSSDTTVEITGTAASDQVDIICKTNRYPKHVKNDNYTLSLLTDSLILYAGQASDKTLTIPESSTFPVEDFAYEYGVMNHSDPIITVQLSGTDIFTNGLSAVKLEKGAFIRFLGAEPTLPPPSVWVISHISKAVCQASYSTTWDKSNFNNFTAVPFDTTDIEKDDLRIEHDNTNVERINIKATGSYQISFGGAIDSTGGFAYAVDFKLRKNGTTDIPSSLGRVGNYQTEDSFFAKTLDYDFTAGDYVELMLDHTSLTGNANNLYLNVKENG